MLGSTRMMAMSSTDWWVLPSPKSESPAEEPQIFTFRRGMATEERIWS